MNNIKRVAYFVLLLVAGMVGGNLAFGQAQGTSPATTPPATDKSKAQAPAPVAPLTMDTTPPVSAEEDAAMKAFRDAPIADVAKKLTMGDDFLQKYPQSRYRAEVLSWQVKGYMSIGQIDKMEGAGEKELALAPNDAQTLAIMGSTMPRSMTAAMSEEQRQAVLNQAEAYSKKALDLVPTLPKPDGITDQQFIAAKNQIQAMAYGGLGLVAFRRAKFAEAVPNLEQSAKYDPNPDPVTYYILAICNQKTSHFDDAAAAFTKCAAISGSLQPTCKAGIDEAKKQAATQLSAPK
jgi:tetratricopeptide (TPR) repeat protein